MTVQFESEMLRHKMQKKRQQQKSGFDDEPKRPAGDDSLLHSINYILIKTRRCMLGFKNVNVNCSCDNPLHQQTCINNIQSVELKKLLIMKLQHA